MSTAIDQFLVDREKLPLPLAATTKSGIEYEPHASVWSFRDGSTNVVVNFELLPEVTPSLLLGLKKTLIWYFENRSARTANHGFNFFLPVIRFVAAGQRGPISCISQDDILAYRVSSDRAKYFLARARGFLCKWIKLGVPGIGSGVQYLLGKLDIKHAATGVAVATLDPKAGPLTDLEFESIQSALNEAYARNLITSEDLLLCYLLISLGSRPSQLASLKCCDLISPLNPGGDYVLQVPRVKQGQLERSEFKARKLSVQLGRPMATYIAGIRTQYAEKFADTSQAPLFPQSKMAEMADAPGLEFHRTSNMLSQQVRRIFRALCAPSERLGGLPIPITPIRFRRTFATRAAEEGWPLLVIAELMDHQDTRHVEVYAGLTTRIRAAFSRKVAFDMAPLAMAFNGKIIRKEDEAIRPGPASRIVDLRVDQSGNPMGSCGTHIQCGFARPMACYGGCHDFEPWLDGPHEQALDYLLARREHLLATTDERIAAINDRAILGCTQVLLRCRQIKSGEYK